LTALSGETPKLWGGSLNSSIVGFGKYHYKYESGREGDSMRIGFANRAQSNSVYIMPGYQDFDDELARLGKHKMGKSCLYLKRLADIDTDVLREILQKGLSIMAEKYPQ
jgi:predicted nuclease of predicted toxin-antitoxin system